jgi:pyrroline-5-carboxylate reductase
MDSTNALPGAGERLAILGAGNIGTAIARGLVRAGRLPATRSI